MNIDSADPGSQNGNGTERSGTSVGIIVGAVIGGLALVALAFAAWWFVVVRKRRSAGTANGEMTYGSHHNKNPEVKPVETTPIEMRPMELQDRGKPAEVVGNSEAVEAGAQSVHEMDGDPVNR